MRYAISRDMLSNSSPSWTFEPWRKMGLSVYDIIKKYWSGPIIWKEKKGKQQFEALKTQIQKAYAVVGERTMACVQSCLLGTPVFTVDNSMTTLLMGGIENLKTLNYPDKNDWWEHICWSQFRADEFDTILPAELAEQYQIEK